MIVWLLGVAELTIALMAFLFILIFIGSALYAFGMLMIVSIGLLLARRGIRSQRRRHGGLRDRARAERPARHTARPSDDV